MQVNIKQEQGAVLLISLLLMLAMAVLAIQSTDGMQIDKQLSVSQKMNTQAFQASSSGLEWSINALTANLAPIIALRNDDLSNYSNDGPFPDQDAINNTIDLQRGKIFNPTGYRLNIGNGFIARRYEITSNAEVGSGGVQNSRSAQSSQVQGVFIVMPQN